MAGIISAAAIFFDVPRRARKIGVMLLLLDTGYVQSFKDKWGVLWSDPIHFVIVCVLVVPIVWFVFSYLFKHRLEMERGLKDGYKERVDVLTQSLTSIGRENEQLKSTSQMRTQDARKLQEQVDWHVGQLKTLQSMFNEKSKEAELMLNEAKRLETVLTLNNEALKQRSRSLAHLRLRCCGVESKNSGHSVEVKFIEPTDADLAEKIRSHFHDDFGSTPYKVPKISQSPWSENPSTKARVVIFSDAPFAEGVKGTFNEFELIPEEVDRLPSRPGDTAEYTIIMFSKAKPIN